MQDCLFCKIVAGEIPASVVYRDDEAVAFDDINPQAPHHVLVIPTKHVASLNEVTSEDEAVLGHLFKVAARIASERGIAWDGFRTVVNTGLRAGQSVFHVHVHMLGGRDLTWPPG
jgi:histidine triad (HIT) family protein